MVTIDPRCEVARPFAAHTTSTPLECTICTPGAPELTRHFRSVAVDFEAYSASGLLTLLILAPASWISCLQLCDRPTRSKQGVRGIRLSGYRTRLVVANYPLQVCLFSSFEYHGILFGAYVLMLIFREYA